MRRHPIDFTLDAQAQLFRYLPDPVRRDACLDWLEDKLTHFPRAGTPAPNPLGHRGAYFARGHLMTVVYEVPALDPEVGEGLPEGEAPGATVSVIAIRPSRGGDLNELIRRHRPT